MWSRKVGVECLPLKKCLVLRIIEEESPRRIERLMCVLRDREAFGSKEEDGAAEQSITSPSPKKAALSRMDLDAELAQFEAELAELAPPEQPGSKEASETSSTASTAQVSALTFPDTRVLI